MKYDITQEDAWAVIRAYFDSNGLVSQQRASFDRFIQFTIQDVIKENSVITVERQPQFAPGSKPQIYL
jgi:DNA-directed RNA polymerase II subunit RPB2